MTDKIKVFLKSKNNRIFAVILILGIMLMMVSGGDNETRTDVSEEKRIEKILQSTDEVGYVEVFISYDEQKNFSSIEKKPSSAVVIVKNYNSYVIRTAAEVVSNVTGIPVHKVMVLKKSK